VDPTCRREGERGEGRRRSGPRGPKAELGRGVGLDFSFLFFLFFLNPFQTNFKPFKFKSFSCFQTQILTQISPTILRLFENLLNNFSTYFKFKLSFF
jgi:hypothetical protein